jgi:hypothetical protein
VQAGIIVQWAGCIICRAREREEIMVSRMKVMAFCLFAAALLCGVPQRALGDDAATKKDKKAAEEKKDKKDSKDTNKGGNFRDGVNRAFDGFKKETTKGKKNLNDLYEREKAK